MSTAYNILLLQHAAYFYLKGNAFCMKTQKTTDKLNIS